VFGELLGACTG